MRATTTQRIILAVVLTSAAIQNLPLTARAEDEKKTDEKTEKAETTACSARGPLCPRSLTANPFRCAFYIALPKPV